MSGGVGLGASLALACAACWTTLDVARRHVGRALDPVSALAAIAVAQTIPCLAWWLIAGGSMHAPAGWIGPGLAILALNTTAGLLFLRAIAIADFSVAIPFLAFGPLWTALAGALLLNEVPRAAQLGGMFAVVCGGAVLVRGALQAADAVVRRQRGAPAGGPPGAAAEPAAPQRSIPDARAWILPSATRAPTEHVQSAGLWRGPLLMTVVSACWAFATALDKVALSYCDAPVHASLQIGGVALVTSALALVRRRTPAAAVTSVASWLALGAVAGTAALALQLTAIFHISVATVDTIKRSVGVLASAVLGRALFDEPLSGRKLLGGALMAAGAAVLVAFG